MIYENGELLAEAPRFDEHPDIVVADIDLELIRRSACARTRSAIASRSTAGARDFHTVGFTLDPPLTNESPWSVRVERYPFVPADDARAARTLLRGLQHPGARACCSGCGRRPSRRSSSASPAASIRRRRCSSARDGVRSAGLPRKNILGLHDARLRARASARKGNAWRLMRALGVSAEEIDIRRRCKQMLKDIGHPFSEGEPVYDVTFENVQAGERTRASVPPRQSAQRRSCSAPAICRSWRSAGAPTASAIRCRTTTSTRACRRR